LLNDPVMVRHSDGSYRVCDAANTACAGAVQTNADWVIVSARWAD
jgi:hypothetical protein